VLAGISGLQPILEFRVSIDLIGERGGTRTFDPMIKSYIIGAALAA
jgi:hypothetical protein